MKLRDFFYPESGDNRDEEEKRFYLKHSDWEPPPQQVNKCLSAHNQVLQSKFDRWKQPVRVSSNLSVEMQKALKDLKNDKEHDIKMDDKGGSFVYADITDYCSAATLDLTKQSNIEELDGIDKKDVIENVEVEVSRVINIMVQNGDMKETTGKFIKQKVKEHRLARFYCNWKCHKFPPTITEFAAAAVRGIV